MKKYISREILFFVTYFKIKINWNNKNIKDKKKIIITMNNSLLFCFCDFFLNNSVLYTVIRKIYINFLWKYNNIVKKSINIYVVTEYKKIEKTNYEKALCQNK